MGSAQKSKKRERRTQDMFGKLNKRTIDLTDKERSVFQEEDLFCSLDSGAINHNCLLKEVNGNFCMVSTRVIDEKQLPKGFYRLMDNRYVEILFDMDGCYCLVPTVGCGYGFPVVSGKTESKAILAWGDLAYRVNVNKNVNTLELSKSYPGWPVYRVCPKTEGLEFVGGEFQGYPIEMATRRLLTSQFLSKIASADSDFQRSSLKLKYKDKLNRVVDDIQTCFSNTRMSPMLDGFPW